MKKKRKQSWNRYGPFFKMMLLLFAGWIVFVVVVIVNKWAGIVTVNSSLLFFVFTGYLFITVIAAVLAAMDMIFFHPDGWQKHNAADFPADPVTDPSLGKKRRHPSGNYELDIKEKRPIRYVAAVLICIVAAAIIIVLILNIVSLSGVSLGWILMRQPLLSMIVCSILVMIVIFNPLLYFTRRYHKKKYYRVSRIAETADHEERTQQDEQDL